MPLVDRYGDPIDHSIISPNHPANERRNHSHDEHGRYTFRLRSSKPLKLTLGWELEANHVPSTPIPAGIENVGDGSVNGAGAEFVVLPAVTKSPRYVLGLLKDLVHAPRLNTDDSCGFHVHVSASNISSLAKMRNWAMATEHLAIQIEDLAFKAVPDSRKSNTYCKRITPLVSGYTFESHKYNNTRRYNWLNTVEMFRPNGIRTIEVRLLGHTHRWKYLLAWSLFSMELARRGWELSLKPFEMTGHVDALGSMLENIAKEIKPLEKRSEPIPEWVYRGLKSHGIETNAWDRPLARLVESEDNLKGYGKQWYSDNQPEEENEDTEECSCGCGSDGRCDYQMCSDGDCTPSECSSCHESGNCGGTPDCEQCRQNAHDDGEVCGRRSCRTCYPSRPVTSPARLSVSTTGVASNRVGSTQLTAESIRTTVELMRSEPIPLQDELDRLYSMRIDTTNLQIHRDAILYGTGVTETTWTSQTFVEPTQETERRAYMMLDTQEQALSFEREQAINMIERANRMLTPLERDATMERLEMTRGCNGNCDIEHIDQDCLACGRVWGSHYGHRCVNFGSRGSFPITGGR